MITLRPFRNGDPPGLVRLWNAAGLGRGAVRGVSVDVFDHLVFAQQHFDPRGLTVAVEDGGGKDPIVGFSLAGFGPAESGRGCDESAGVIAAVLVRPDARRRGIGRRLLNAAVEYLRERGAERIAAGAGPGEEPFLVGLYGGSGPAGLLESDPAAAPFVTACGFAPGRRRAVLQRPADGGDRTGFQVLAVRRRSVLRAAKPAGTDSWWWSTRYGRLDTLRFELAPRSAAQEPATAGVTLIGLDLYGASWGRRAVGLRDLAGDPAHAHALILEVSRRLREEAVDLLEIHADADDAATLTLLSRMGFEPVDHGTRFRLERSP